MSQRKRLRIDGKRVYAYRHKVEQALGHKLGKSQHVHHINGDVSDDSFTNLAVLSAGQHSLLTRLERWAFKPIICFRDDGTPYQAQLRITFEEVVDDEGREAQAG